jgi:diacylglycerol kinase family enzyme
VVELDDGTTIAGGTMAIVAKTSPYTFVGNRPIVVTPRAGLDTPLSIAVLKAHRAAPMLGLAARAIIGQHGMGRSHAAVVRDGVAGLTITAADPIPHQADGEYLGETTRLRLEHHPACLTIVTPTA